MDLQEIIKKKFPTREHLEVFISFYEKFPDAPVERWILQLSDKNEAKNLIFLYRQGEKLLGSTVNDFTKKPENGYNKEIAEKILNLFSILYGWDRYTLESFKKEYQKVCDRGIYSQHV